MTARRIQQRPAPPVRARELPPDYNPRKIPEGAPPDFFRLWTVNDVARALHRHPMTIYTLVEEGEIKVVRIGNGRGSIRFRKEDVDAYINAHIID
jgi:excisionase family DNA binding protein